MTLTTLFLLLGTLQASCAFVPSNAAARSSWMLQASKAETDESAPTVYSGATGGKVSVDMNKYNLSPEQAVQEWSANLKPENAFEGSGAYLGAKSAKENFVDTVRVVFPRLPDSGLGILLEEIAGGREDGLGITVAAGLVEGGASDGSGILVGDCISSIAIETSSTEETLAAVSTECLGYDATVDTILSLPAAQSDDEVFVLSVKRLRRKPRVNVKIQYPPGMGEQDISLELFSGENLRRAMLTRGVKLNDPMARRFDSGGTGSCGAEGTCATCVVSVLKGSELLNPQNIQEQQILSDNPRWRMGCKAIVGYGFQEGDITLRLNPKQWEQE